MPSGKSSSDIVDQKFALALLVSLIVGLKILTPPLSLGLNKLTPTSD